MADIIDRLTDTPCNREPFTPSHAECQCRLAGEAAREIDRLRKQVDLLRHAVWVAQNDYAHADPHSPFVRVIEATKPLQQ